MRRVVTLTAVLSLSGCVDTSPDRVKLTTTVTNVKVALAPGPLVVALSGSFDIAFDVGDLASGDDTIRDPPSIQLVTASDHATLSVLDAVPSGASFPLTLKSGEKLTVTFTLTDQNTLQPADQSRACAGPVEVVVSYTDSLSGNRATSIDSSASTLGGCP